MAVKFTAVAAATLAAGTPAEGEYVRTTDTKKLYMGDGATQGGILIGPVAAGTGDVTVSGTPADGQIAIWTDGDTIEGDSALSFATATDTLSIAASGNLAFGTVTVLDDNAGTMTLSNVDALDATTEATIEAAIDTLANLTSIQGCTVTLADAGADAILGWDDSAGAYENLTQDEVRAIAGLAITDSPQFAGINLGDAADTTITRTGAGAIAVEGTAVLLSGGALGTPQSGILTNCTGLPTTGVSNSVNDQSSQTSYELAAADKNKTVILSSSSAVTVNVDSDGITWALNDQVHFLNLGSGAVTIQGGGTTPVTIHKASDQTAVLAQYKAATLVFESDSAATLVGGMGGA